MHPFRQSNELCLEISSDPYPENTTPQPDHHHHHRVTSSTNKLQKSHQRSSTTNPTSKTKMMHRDIERQRRQEMAARCASLRSLLPLEFIKGKRSISDHMNEAVNYIKHLQNNVGVLGAKRDELKELSNSREESSSSSYLPCHVMARPVADGVEVLLSSGVIREQDLPLSRVLEIVIQEGLVVVNCSSTKVNERLLHTIQAQVSDPDCNIDPSELQEKLKQAVFRSSDRFPSSNNLSD